MQVCSGLEYRRRWAWLEGEERLKEARETDKVDRNRRVRNEKAEEVMRDGDMYRCIGSEYRKGNRQGMNRGAQA